MNDHEAPLATAAAGKLKIAQRRLVHRYPFHARLVGMWEVAESKSVPTVGVTARRGAIQLLYNPTFVVNCSIRQLQGVLLHEVNHVLFGHIFADPAQFPDRGARLIAEETTVNEWVAELLPGKPITLADFPELPPNEDTDTRYARLARRKRLPVPESGDLVPKTGGSDPKMRLVYQNRAVWSSTCRKRSTIMMYGSKPARMKRQADWPLK